MDAKSVKSFVERDRARVQNHKREHWARLARESNGQETLAAGWRLFAHARAVDPEFPRPESRADDLAHHVRLNELIGRASRRFTNR